MYFFLAFIKKTPTGDKVGGLIDIRRVWLQNLISQREKGGLLEREAYYKNLTHRGRVIREG